MSRFPILYLHCRGCWDNHIEARAEDEAQK